MRVLTVRLWFLPRQTAENGCINEIRDTVVKLRFEKRTCCQWWQIKAELAMWEGKGVVSCAATGAGKTVTLTFWIPLLMAQVDGMDSV